MGPRTLIGFYVDIDPGEGLAGIELLQIFRTADDRVIAECCDCGEFRMVAAMIEGTAQNMDLLRQIADAMRARPAA